MSDAPEKQAIISGIGISRIGRKTDVGHLDLTTESAAAAIADAGLRPDDIDGIATMGDTPPTEVDLYLGGQIRIDPHGGNGWFAGSRDGRALAVANGDARHVLVYRTVQMIGGSILPPSGGEDALAPPVPRPSGLKRRHLCRGRRRQRDGRHGTAAHSYGVQFRGELARHASQRHTCISTARRSEHQAIFAVNSRRATPRSIHAHVPQANDDGRLSQRAARLGSVRAARLRRADRRVDRGRGVVGRVAARLSESAGPGGVDGWFARDRCVRGTSAPTIRRWFRSKRPPSSEQRPTSHRRMSTSPSFYDRLTFLTPAWLEALGFCGTGESGPFVEGGTRIASRR